MELWTAQLLETKVAASPHVDEPVSPRPEVLYHYTTAEGLLGILTSNALRAGNVLYMNDATELQYAVDLVQRIMNEKLAAAGVAPAVREFLERSSHGFSMSFGYKPHVACFCENGDLLSQWRAYADRGGGYAIGFETLPLARPAEYLRSPITADLLRVEYDRKLQKDEIEKRIEAICNALQQCVKDHPGEENILVSAACISFRLADLLFSYKYSAFSEEQEWRLVSLQDPTSTAFEFRAGTGFLVPYIELEPHLRAGPNVGKLPISEITLGPTLHPDLAKASVELLLQKRGFHHVKVNSSAVPLRL